MIEETLNDIVNSIDRIGDKLDPSNDFGQTIGDELHAIEYQLGRIADILEQIFKNMK